MRSAFSLLSCSLYCFSSRPFTRLWDKNPWVLLSSWPPPAALLAPGSGYGLMMVPESPLGWGRTGQSHCCVRNSWLYREEKELARERLMPGPLAEPEQRGEAADSSREKVLVVGHCCSPHLQQHLSGAGHFFLGQAPAEKPASYTRDFTDRQLFA